MQEDQYARMKPGVWLVLDILRVDGEDVHAGFEANFAQGGDYVRWHFADVYQATGVTERPVDLVTHFGGEADWVVPWETDVIREAEEELHWLRTGAWGQPDGESMMATEYGYDGDQPFEGGPTVEELQSMSTASPRKLVLTFPTGLDNSAFFFAVDLGLDDKPEVHNLRLDVLNSDHGQLCQPVDTIFLAGSSLHNSHLANLHRHPTAHEPFSPDFPSLVFRDHFTLPSGPVLEASFSVGCVEPDHEDVYDPELERWMKPGVFVYFKIESVDGVDVSYRNLGFDVNYFQGGPYISYHSAGHHFPETKTWFFAKTHGDADVLVEWHPEMLDSPTSEQIDFWVQNIPLKLSSAEEDVSAPVEEQTDVEGSDAVEEECSDLECLMAQVKEGMTIEEFKKIDAQAERLVDEILGKQHKKQKPLVTTPTDEQEETVLIMNAPSQKMKPIVAEERPASLSLEAPTATPTGLFLAALPPQEQDLLWTLFLAGTAFLLFTAVSVLIFRARPGPEVQRLPVHRREAQEERMARLANRRAAFQGFLSGLLCGLISFDEKTAEAPQGRDLRREQTGEPEEPSMEQDIAGFRAAADMVESMIAAEEGRNRQVMEQSRQPQTAEAPPPTYETDRAESGVVADGFRYTRVGEVEGGQSSSDRLGYGNKD